MQYLRRKKRILIEFRTGLTEQLFCDGKYRQKQRRLNFTVGSDTQIINDIPVSQQYTVNDLDPDSVHSAYHYIIYRDSWLGGTIPEQRIAYHRLYQKLLDHIDHDDYYPRIQRLVDLDAIRSDESTRYMHNGDFYLYPAGANYNTPWRRWAEHYFQVSAKFDPKSIDDALYIVSNKVKIDISTYEVRKRASINIGGSRAYNPMAYVAIMERSGVKDSVIDLHPDLGHKAIACSILGLKYICPKTPKFEWAVNRGFVSELGLVHEWLDDQEANTLISDNNFACFELDKALNLSDRCRKLIAFARSEERIKVTKKYKPLRTLVLRRSRYRAPGYVLIW